MIDLQFLVHALIVLIVGLLSGAPMGMAITRNLGEDKVRGWRVAHSGLSMGGTMLVAFAVVTGHLQLTGLRWWSVAGPGILSGYGFAIGLPLGAATGRRGLTRGGPWQNRMVYSANLIGAWGSLIATLALLSWTIEAIVTGSVEGG